MNSHIHIDSFLTPMGSGCSLCNLFSVNCGFHIFGEISCPCHFLFRQHPAEHLVISGVEKQAGRAVQAGLKIQFSDCWFRFPPSKSPGYKFACLQLGSHSLFWLSGLQLLSDLPLPSVPFPSSCMSKLIKLGVSPFARVRAAGHARRGCLNHTTGLWSRTGLHLQHLSIAELCGQTATSLIPFHTPP